jgi:predicted DNA-binding transcriptional regulator YafY
LWLTLQVYQRLNQHLRLPVRIPQALLDHLAGQVTPTDIAAAEVAAGQVLADLRRALDGYVPFPPWPEGGLPEEESLAVIEEALATGQNLRLRYYAAGTETLTQRVVEPYRIERRGETPYLIGFCHRAQAERMFRVDRIYAVVKVRSDG